MTQRTTFLDFDARRDPKTERFCSHCQRDLSPTTRARVIRMVPGEPFIVHPADAVAGDAFGLLGPKCQRYYGSSWSRPEEP